MGNAVLLVFILTLGTSLAVDWTQHSYATSVLLNSKGRDLVKLSVSPSNGCLYETLHVRWNSTTQTDLNDVLISVAQKGATGFLTAPLTSTSTWTASNSPSANLHGSGNDESRIKCLINEFHCSPSVDYVKTSPERNRLIIAFKEATNEPDLLSTRAVNQALSITPPLTGAAIGDWKSPTLLEILVDVEYLDMLFRRHRAGELIEISARPQPTKVAGNNFRSINSNEHKRYPQQSNVYSTAGDINLSGYLKLLPREHGTLQIFAVQTALAATDQSPRKERIFVVSEIAEVDVSLCDDAVAVLPSLQFPSSTTDVFDRESVIQSVHVSFDGETRSDIDNSAIDAIVVKANRNVAVPAALPRIEEIHRIVEAQPVIRVDGVLPITGTEPLKLGNASVVPMTQGKSWSLSMWLNLLEGPTGTHRALFHKGPPKGTTDGSLAQRTPSAWLLPDSNRLALRVSTNITNDIGADTRKEIPLGRWTLLTFVFENLTIPSPPPRPSHPSSDPLHSSSPLHPLSDDVDLIQQSRRGSHRSSDDEATEQPGQSNNPSTQQEKAGGRSSRSEDSGGVVDHQRRSNFRIAVYLNGEMDTELNFLQDVVVRNEHPLQLFRDVSHFGPKSLITDLILWDVALSHERIRSLYLARAGQALSFSPSLSTASVGAVTSRGSLPTSVEDPAIPPRTTTTTTTTAAAEGRLHDQWRRKMKNTFAIDSTDAAMALLSTSARALFKQLNWSPTPLKSKLDVGGGMVFVYQPLYSSFSFTDMDVGLSGPAGGSGSDAIGRGIREAEEEEDEEEHGGHGHERGNGQDSDSSSSTTKAAVQALLQEAAASALSCGAFSRRLDIYAEAASLYGSAEALYHWGMLMSLGSEHASVQCGFDEDVLGSNYNEPTENTPTSTSTSTSISKRLSSSPSLSPPATEQSSSASAVQQPAGAESAEEIDGSGMEGSDGNWEGKGEENGSESGGISDKSLSDIASGRQRGEPSGKKEQGAPSASKQQSLQPPPAVAAGGGEGGGEPSFRTEHQRIDDYVRNQHQQQQRALYAFLVAADMGYAPALLPIALAVLSGIGIETLLQHDLKILAHTGVRNPPPPPPPAAGAGRKGASSEKMPRRLWYVPVPEEYIVIRPVSVRDTAGLGNVAGRSYYRRTTLQRRLGEYLVRATEDCHRSIHQRNYRERRRYEEPLPGYSVLCPAHSAAVYREKRREGKKGREEERDPTLIAVGLLHVASVFGDQEANAALSYRYEHGLGGVTRSTETAAQFALRAVAAAQEAFYKVGGQPVMDDARINDRTVRELPKGNQGEDDELIQNQIIRAKEGHLPSILAMADLYYFGARGLPRDQPLALRYFEQAAALGDSMGLCGAAAMYLKGEGLHNNNNTSSVENADSLDRNAPSEPNVTHAVILYEKAASMGSIKALNGLGFIYFHGHHAPAYPQNHTKAYEYFLTAAEAGTDGDSLFNTGFCVENGLGTRADFVRARSFYEHAAKKFGHFGSVTALGDMYMEGRGVERSPSIALQYLKPAKSIGPWAGWLRRGFDQYLLALSVPQLTMTSRAANVFGIRGDGKGSVSGMFGGIVDDFNDYFGADSSISSSLSHIASAGAGLLSSALSSVLRSTASSLSATDPATIPNIGDSPSEAKVLALSVAELSRRGRRHVSHMRSLSCYVRAGELGYEISQSNAAYILRSKLNTGMLPTQRTSYPTAPAAALQSYAGASLVEYSVGRRTPTTSNLPSHSHTSHSTAISPTSSITVPLPVTWSDSAVENESLSKEEESKERISHTLSHTSTSSATSPSAAATTPAAVVSPDAALWLERLYFRESLLSAHHGNKDSVLEIGHCYFKNSCGLHESEFDTKQRQPETSASTPRYSATVGPSAVVWWYSKASHLGNAMASVYLGVMYHFGVGGVQPLSLPQQSPGTTLVAPLPTLSPGTGATAAADGSSDSGSGGRAGGFEIEVERVNYVRAARYYEDAMKPGSDLDSQPQLRAMVQALQYMLRHFQGSSSSSDGNNKGNAIWGGGGRGGGGRFGLFSSMHVGVDYVVRRLWGEP